MLNLSRFLGEREKIEASTLTYWQRIFVQARVNGGTYTGDTLPLHRRVWPRDTYLQRRLKGKASDSGERRS